MNKVAIVIWCWKKKTSRFSLDLLIQTYANWFLLIRSLFLSSFPSFWLFLALFDFWWCLKASEILQVAKFDRLLRSSTSDNYAPMKVRSFANSFEVAFKSRFSSKWSLLCWATSSSVDEWRAVSFSYRPRPWKPRPRTQTSFSLEARSTPTRHWTAGRTKALSILPSQKKAGQKAFLMCSRPA